MNNQQDLFPNFLGAKKGEKQDDKKVGTVTDVGGWVLEKPALMLQGFDTNKEGHLV